MIQIEKWKHPSTMVFFDRLYFLFDFIFSVQRRLGWHTKEDTFQLRMRTIRTLSHYWHSPQPIETPSTSAWRGAPRRRNLDFAEGQFLTSNQNKHGSNQFKIEWEVLVWPMLNLEEKKKIDDINRDVEIAIKHVPQEDIKKMFHWKKTGKLNWKTHSNAL